MADHDLKTLEALFWSEFSVAAKMSAKQPECLKWIIDCKKYHATTKARLPRFNELNRELLDQTLSCARRAGRVAGKRARDAGERQVPREIFKEACEEQEHRVEELRKKNQKSGENGAFGGIC